MLVSSRGLENIPGSTHNGSEEVCASNDRRFFAVFSTSGAVTLHTSSLAALLDLRVSVSLLNTLSRDWTFSRVKIQDLTKPVRMTTVFMHYYLSGGVVLENLFRNLGVITTGGALAVVRL